MRSTLDKLRQSKFVGVAELAREAARILVDSGLAQERGTVTELPDERTIRYYMTEGLIPSAGERQGTASVFGYRHLLLLVLVKKLQSEYVPIRKIRDLVEGRSESDLEKMLGTQDAPAAKNEALAYLEKLLTNSPSSHSKVQAFQSSAPPSSLPPNPAAAVPQSPQGTQTGFSGTGSWARVEIEPGLELHVHDQYHPPTDSKGLKRLTQFLLGVINSHGREPGKRGN